MRDPSAGGHTGILTIAAWRDFGQFRARVRWTFDVDTEEESIEVCDSEEAVRALVERWLAGLARSAGDRDR